MVCMECAVQVAMHPGGACCPQCGQVFETVTWYDGRFVATNTLYDRAADPLVPFHVGGRNEDRQPHLST